MILFEAIYCIIMFLLYFIGSYLFAGLCASRYIFYHEWTSLYDLQILLLGLATFVLHYVLLWIGYKKGFLDRFIIRALKILDLVLYGSQLTLLTFLWIFTTEHFNAREIIVFLPTFAIDIIAIVLRLLTSKKISMKLH